MRKCISSAGTILIGQKPEKMDVDKLHFDKN